MTTVRPACLERRSKKLILHERLLLEHLAAVQEIETASMMLGEQEELTLHWPTVMSRILRQERHDSAEAVEPCC